MSRLLYRILYSVGFKPWEQETETEASQLRQLLDREEDGRQPLGRALDLGCGTGRWSLELARRGWDVTGVDIVPKAIADARERAGEAGIENVRFIEGDVTALPLGDLGPGYRFFLDAECFNHLTDEQRREMGRQVNAVATSDATMLLLVWRRARRGPFPAGAGRDDIEAAFDGWRVTHEDAYTTKLPPPLRRIKPCWYRLARS